MKTWHRRLAQVGMVFGVGWPAPAPAAGVGPLPPAALAERLAFGEIKIVASEETSGGVTSSQKLTIQLGDDATTIAAKWKKTGRDGDGWNNSPRREIGAYIVQGWFLDADDYIVPPTAARCIDLDAYTVIEPAAGATFDGTRCVFGNLSLWLEGVKRPAQVFDRERFRRDPGYAVSFANLNLLHYLIQHRDGRVANFLESTEPGDPRLFSIDNGIAFGNWLFNWFTRHFDKIRVGGLPRRSIDRLRRISRQDLERLGVLAELHRDDDGVLRNVAAGRNRGSNQAVRIHPGGVQIGLTGAEIEAVEKRLNGLLSRIDAGQLSVF